MFIFLQVRRSRGRNAVVWVNIFNIDDEKTDDDDDYLLGIILRFNYDQIALTRHTRQKRDMIYECLIVSGVGWLLVCAQKRVQVELKLINCECKQASRPQSTSSTNHACQAVKIIESCSNNNTKKTLKHTAHTLHI